MLGSILPKLDTLQTPAWQLLRRWRWWVALACALLGYLVEQLEHQLELHLDTFEILAYSLILPFTIWLIITWLARALAERSRVVAAQAQQQLILEQLDKRTGWDELTQFVFHLPADLLPVKHARLYTYDHTTAGFQLAGEWAAVKSTAMPEPDYATCKTCLATRMPHKHPDRTDYCQPLIYDGLLIGVLRAQFHSDRVIDERQLQFLNSIAPKLALALAMCIAQPQRLTQAQSEARHDERRQLAYELHDTLAQNLGYLHLSLDRLAEEGDAPRGELLQQELTALREIAADAYHQVRDQLTWLYSQQSADLIKSLRYYTQLIERRSRVRVSFVTHGEPANLAPGIPMQIIGLVRESLNNVQRHACAYEAQVVLYWSEDLLVVAVVDDGLGFNPLDQLAPSHHGLTMLRERVDRLGGQLHIHSAPNLGTRLIFYVPLDQNSARVTGQWAIQPR